MQSMRNTHAQYPLNMSYSKRDIVIFERCTPACNILPFKMLFFDMFECVTLQHYDFTIGVIIFVSDEFEKLISVSEY